ncbi:MAG: helix-turn-helix transcriptional regulator [Candidatus Wildermuthbacteria bacterium]|nr:helix-turn-helix transcriptional regulator [Candidatus Wildermuthbacteria bacterium]
MNRAKTNTAKDFQEYLAQSLRSIRFKKQYDEYGKQLEISYQILQLRKKEKLSQVELARRLKTSQSDVARMEAGQQNFSTRTLEKIASVFRRKLKIEFIE